VDLLAPILVIVAIVLLFWLPTEMLHKAGFSRWLGLLIPLTGYIAIIVFAFIEWPIHRELAWWRLAAGSPSEGDLPRAQSYAIDLEKRGEWQRAIEVYEVLAQRSPDKQEAEYAAKCASRLRAQLERSTTT